MIYGLLIVPGADRMFHLVAIVVTGSTIAHSSTGLLFARWFRRAESETKPPKEQ